MYKLLISLVLIFACFVGQAQEIAPERLTTYTFSLNKLKTQDQVTSIESTVKAVEHVSSCNLDWINYQMVVKVDEGGTKGNFSMENLKAILTKNNAALKSFTKKSDR